MAAPAELRERIEADLRFISDETAFLPELAEGWSDESETNRLVWHQEWRDLMARLIELDDACRNGLMTPEQRGRYRELFATLEQVKPIIRRLELMLPPVSLKVD